jgi:hypothetical protein
MFGRWTGTVATGGALAWEKSFEFGEDHRFPEHTLIGSCKAGISGDTLGPLTGASMVVF